MKELKRLKLVHLSSEALRAKEMNLLRGGTGETDCCGCGFGIDNRNANSAAGYGQSAGDTSGNCWNWEYNGSGWSYTSDHTHC